MSCDLVEATDLARALGRTSTPLCASEDVARTPSRIEITFTAATQLKIQTTRKCPVKNSFIQLGTHSLGFENVGMKKTHSKPSVMYEKGERCGTSTPRDAGTSNRSFRLKRKGDKP